MANSRPCQSWAQSIQSLPVHSESKSKFLQHPSRPSTIWGLAPSTNVLPPLSSSSSSAALAPLNTPDMSYPWLGLCICCFFPSGMLFPPESHLVWFLISFISGIKCHLLKEAYLNHTIYNFIPLCTPVHLRAFGQFGGKSIVLGWDCPLPKPKG